MIKPVRVIETAAPTSTQLAAFKSYAKIADNSRDSELTNILARAFEAVQSAANIALLTTKLEVTATDLELGEPIRLYRTPATIVSVTDGSGNALAYDFNGSVVTLKSYSPVAVVTYTSTASSVEASLKFPIVLEYATALEAGDVVSMNKVLAQC